MVRSPSIGACSICNIATISGFPPRPFWNRQENRNTESSTSPGLAKEGCGGVVFSAMTGNLPCDKHTKLTYVHVSKEFHLEFSVDNGFTCRLRKGEGSRAIEYNLVVPAAGGER